jgi:hypothetical protein
MGYTLPTWVSWRRPSPSSRNWERPPMSWWLV